MKQNRITYKEGDMSFHSLPNCEWRQTYAVTQFYLAARKFSVLKVLESRH